MKKNKKTKKYCKRCKSEVQVEKNKDIDYPYYCPKCNENMYSFEVKNNK